MDWQGGLLKKKKKERRKEKEYASRPLSRGSFERDKGLGEGRND
jgi:hypothetical protein